MNEGGQPKKRQKKPKKPNGAAQEGANGAAGAAGKTPEEIEKEMLDLAGGKLGEDDVEAVDKQKAEALKEAWVKALKEALAARRKEAVDAGLDDAETKSILAFETDAFAFAQMSTAIRELKLPKWGKAPANKLAPMRARIEEILKENIGSEGAPGEDEGSQADRLVAMTRANAKLFCTRGRVAFADVTVKGHRETLVIDSGEFREWLCDAYYAASKGKTPRGQSIADAVNTLRGIAKNRRRRSQRVCPSWSPQRQDLSRPGRQSVERD